MFAVFLPTLRALFSEQKFFRIQWISVILFFSICTSYRNCAKSSNSFPANVIRTKEFFVRLRGGEDQLTSDLSSNTVQIIRGEGPICLSDDSDSLQSSSITRNSTDSSIDILEAVPIREPAVEEGDELQVVLSSSHRFTEVKEPAYEDPLDDPSLCPAVQFFLTRCPTGKVRCFRRTNKSPDFAIVMNRIAGGSVCALCVSVDTA